MPAAISANQISKRYRTPAAPVSKRSQTGTNRAWRGTASLLSRVPQLLRRGGANDLWALQDVSFEIQPGEVVGIIGRNGAGKSTLLKVLGRITRPTRGTARIRGQVSTLLEVGTGFHPELTGRENIYLSAAIHGMRRGEIARKFDAIVDFAEIGSFLQLPVKRYSSGMYVRLAFAVAAHLDPEILLLDEVLAVGDVAFQKKCLSRIGSLSTEERTVLFVSHHMGTIRQLCPRSILIDHGRVVTDGPTQETVRTYHELLRNVTAAEGVAEGLGRGTGAVRITDLEVETPAGTRQWDFQTGETIRIRFTYRAFEPASDLRFFFGLQSSTHCETLTSLTDVVSSQPLAPGAAGSCVVEIPDNVLCPGDYFFQLSLGTVQGVTYDNVTTQNASLPPLTIWSDETDQHKIGGFFSTPMRLVRVGPTHP